MTYNIEKTDLDDLLTIPDFLNMRIPQTRKAWKDLIKRTEREARLQGDRAARQRKSLAIARENERRERENTKRAKQQKRAQGKLNTRQRRDDREAVVNLIACSHVTIGQMVKASDIPQDRIKLALRWLLKNERINKPTPRTYSL